MAVFYNDKGERSESFVWKPRPACCLNADGTCDYTKLNALIEAAKAGDKKAKILVFENYVGTWQPLCMQSDEVMYRLAMDYEDFQQEAFECFLKSVETFGDSAPENFRQFFLINLKNRILNLLKNIEKQIIGHKILKTQKELKDFEDTGEYRFPTCYSMQETTKEGNPKYDFPDSETENEYFKDYYPRVSQFLTERELEIVIDCYVRGMSFKEKAKQLGISYIWIKKINASIKDKLKVLDK